VSLFGEANKSKGYKLANKYFLLDVVGKMHVLTKGGKGSVPVALGGGDGDEMLGAGDSKRLVCEGDLFDVLWDTHVDEGGHCKARTFDDRVKSRFTGIPRCVHAAPSHPPSSYTLLPHPTPVPSHLTAPSQSHSQPTPIPLTSRNPASPCPSHSHPLPLQVGARDVCRVLRAVYAQGVRQAEVPRRVASHRGPGVQLTRAGDRTCLIATAGAPLRCLQPGGCRPEVASSCRG
jgi:hypothetical protein